MALLFARVQGDSRFSMSNDYRYRIHQAKDDNAEPSLPTVTPTAH